MPTDTQADTHADQTGDSAARSVPRVVVAGDRRAVDAEGMEQDIKAAPAEIIAVTWYGEETLQTVEALRPDAVIIDLAPSVEASIQTLRQLTAADPTLPIVVLPPDGGELAARSLVISDRIEVVAKPLRPWTLTGALRRLLGDPAADATEPAAPQRAAARGRVIAVIGAKGGVGTTTFAVNLGVALRYADAERVSLVDLNVWHGDVALATDIVPTRSIADLAREGDRVDPDLVASYFVEHRSGMLVLPAPARPSGAIVDPLIAKHIIRMVAARSNFVLLDLPRGFGPLQRAAIQAADNVLVVVGNDVGSLKNGRILLDAIDAMEKGPPKTQIIVNQIAPQGGLSRKDCESMLERKAFHELPHDRQMLAAWTEGRPLLELATRSEYSRAVGRVARVFAPGTQLRRRGFRLRLPSWRRQPAAPRRPEAAR